MIKIKIEHYAENEPPNAAFKTVQQTITIDEPPGTLTHWIEILNWLDAHPDSTTHILEALLLIRSVTDRLKKPLSKA